MKNNLILLAIILLGVFGLYKYSGSTYLTDFGKEIIEEKQTKYNNIIVFKQQGIIFFSFGKDSKLFQSAHQPEYPEKLVANYTKFMTLSLVYAGKLENMLALGLGGGKTVSYINRTIPELNIQVAELDEGVKYISEKYFTFAENDKLKVSISDGRKFLANSNEKYDIISLDAYNGESAPFHILTKEFYELVNSKLEENGVVMQNITFRNTELFNSTAKTLKEVFDNVDFYDTRSNIVAIAYNGEAKTTAELKEKAIKLESEYSVLYSFEKMLDAKTNFYVPEDAKILTDDFAPVNNLIKIKTQN